MPVATEKPGAETRSILAPTGNRVRLFEEQKRRKETTKKPKKVISQSPAKPSAAAAAAAVVRCNVSADSSSDSSSSAASSSNGSNVKSAKSRGSGGIKNSYGVVKSAKIVSLRVESSTLTPAVPLPIKRCDWITPNSESLYTSFHDEEWGVPVHDDIKLFELLVLSQALAELAWPMILSKRSIFRKLFEEFDPTLVGNLDADKLLSMRVQGSTLLSEPKLRSIIENAKQVLKIQQEFGSFSNYCWRFVNHKPIKSGFRYGRHVPAKTPKSELISKDLMQRGFRCTGPTVVYSFMQVAGLVNDHLVTCFRYNECGHSTEKVPGSKPDSTAQVAAMEIKTSTSDESGS
ncbi:probable gmp synthase [glutamine-hydrolyzing] [Phtheirospermum japonicum]|uniref:Probable gmp synthase [glutamine-hydrolyzing] n=1 Tax=Phtheirospermum japonicum TaxID=374723 RepID=A0A830BX69_9LAMI|nr:probable gmp synthase [glutamine-hydrolyzing] [Phtheirospermum japonicum]